MTDPKAIAKNPPFPKNYASEFIVFEKGEGCYLEDIKGGRYLDFGSGIAVNSLGHGRKDLANVAAKQMEKLIHVSNLYTTKPAIILASKLVALGNFAAAHFGSSGSEANEAALKYARLYSLRKKGEGHHKILSFNNAFHGRTMGSLSVTPTEKYKAPFYPLVPGCEVINFNDIEALKNTLDDTFAAVIIEPIQGEGGLEAANKEFCMELNSLCKKHDVILIADEVQTGLCRTGAPFASSIVDLNPDIITLAKPLAGGLPLSATLIPEKVNSLIHPGEHGTTFGGGPVTCAVANYILDAIFDPEIMMNIIKSSDYLEDKLQELCSTYSFVIKTKGAGLLKGLEIEGIDCSEIIKKASDNGLLILRAGTNVLRFAPPLIVTEKEIDEAIEILKSVFNEYK